MKEDILINVTPQETRVAILEDGVVQELHIERTAQLGLVGNIYLGVVKRVLPGMQSAFLEIGLERAAFLHIADIHEQRQHPEQEQRIERVLFEGQRVVVQVIKDPIGTKGARLSTQISLAGRYLVHLPQDDHIGVSQKITVDEERTLLRERLQRLIPPDSSHGFIIRTNAETATDEELEADIQYLSRLWASIRDTANKSPPQRILYQDLSLPLRVLRDFLYEDTQRVIVDSRETHTKMLEFAQNFVTNGLDRIEHYQGSNPLFESHNIEAEIEKALSRRVDLKFGGYLVFDQTEAMTTVDINTGGFVGARNFDETIFKTNLEAAQAIARQLRLRNLGGIIIIDFIDMDNTEHQAAVLEELTKALTKDRTRTTINGFTSLGLVEVTRKRTRESLAHVLCEPCPTCQGRGEIRTAQTVCFEILREIVREARAFNAKEYRVFGHPKVIEMFLDEESQSLAMVSEFIGKPISLQVESLYTQERYDIILM